MSHPAVSPEALQVAITTIRESLDSASRDLPEAPATAERVASIPPDPPPMRLSDSAIEAFKGPGRSRIGKFLRFQRVAE